MLQISWHFKILQDHIWELKIQNATPTVFHSISAKLHEGISCNGRRHALLLVLAIDQVKKKKTCGTLKFNMGVNGEILKCAIS